MFQGATTDKRNIFPNKKTLFILALFLLSGTVLTAYAQTSTQETSLIIAPGNLYPRYSPENFALEPIFVDPLSSTANPVYTTFPSSITEETLSTAQQTSIVLPGQFVIEDAIGNPFEAQIHFSNLIDTGANKIIPFTAISFVTLANNPVGIDSFNSNTPPANTVGVTAPVACIGWNNDIASNCESQFNSNSLESPNTPHPADPIFPLNESETIIYVNPAAPYSENAIIEFSDGEKALIISRDLDNEYIIVRRGILNTTATSHPAAEGITCYGHSSIPLTIMDGIPNPNRIGSYTVGFGLRLLVEPYFEPGDYVGLITFDTVSP